MSTVLAMRLNESQALLVADESTWHLGAVLGYRRTNYGDALANLIDPDESQKLGVAAVYAGVGFPSFHHEVARRAKAMLAQPGGKESAIRRDGTGLGRIVQEAYLATHERMLNDKLRFNYGFGRDALNSRAYSRDGRKLEIGQDLLVEAARNIAAGNARATAYARFFQNQGLVVTFDRNRGVQCWYVDATGCHLGFATAIATLGEGDEVASHLLSRFIQRRDLGQRRKGFELIEGLYVGMSVATEIRTSVGKMGGYFQIVFLDGANGARELVSDAAHLASEVMRAHHWGFITRKDAEEFTRALILDGACDLEVEKALFERTSEPDKLRRYLMGFKPVDAPAGADLEAEPAAAEPARKSAPKAVLEAVQASKSSPRPRPSKQPRNAARATRQPMGIRRGGDLR